MTDIKIINILSRNKVYFFIPLTKQCNKLCELISLFCRNPRKIMLNDSNGIFHASIKDDVPSFS